MKRRTQKKQRARAKRWVKLLYKHNLDRHDRATLLADRDANPWKYAVAATWTTQDIHLLSGLIVQKALTSSPRPIAPLLPFLVP